MYSYLNSCRRHFQNAKCHFVNNRTLLSYSLNIYNSLFNKPSYSRILIGSRKKPCTLSQLSSHGFESSSSLKLFSGFILTGAYVVYPTVMIFMSVHLSLQSYYIFHLWHGSVGLGWKGEFWLVVWTVWTLQYGPLMDRSRTDFDKLRF